MSADLKDLSAQVDKLKNSDTKSMMTGVIELLRGIEERRERAQAEILKDLNARYMAEDSVENLHREWALLSDAESFCKAFWDEMLEILRSCNRAGKDAQDREKIARPYLELFTIIALDYPSDRDRAYFCKTIQSKLDRHVDCENIYVKYCHQVVSKTLSEFN